MNFDLCCGDSEDCESSDSSENSVNKGRSKFYNLADNIVNVSAIFLV